MPLLSGEELLEGRGISSAAFYPDNSCCRVRGGGSSFPLAFVKIVIPGPGVTFGIPNAFFQSLSMKSEFVGTGTKPESAKIP